MEALGNSAKLLKKITPNYDAEIAAIENALDLLKTQVQAKPVKKQNIVIFTDAMSALES